MKSLPPTVSAVLRSVGALAIWLCGKGVIAERGSSIRGEVKRQKLSI